MSLNLEKIFNSDGLHRRVLKHNRNYCLISENLDSIINGYLPLSGGSLTGGVYAPSVSATTFYSGSTDLSLIFGSGGGGPTDITRIQHGVNTFTGGTDNLPNVNVTGLTIDNIAVSGDSIFGSLSANTFYSGDTDLSEIIASIASESSTGCTATTLNNWISYSGATDRYYEDFYHGLESYDVDVTVYNLANYRDVIPEEIERVDENIVRIIINSSGYTLRAVVQKCGGSGSSDDPNFNGDVFGPESSENNSIARFDETSGKVIKTSNATINDLGGMFVDSFSANTIHLGVLDINDKFISIEDDIIGGYF